MLSLVEAGKREPTISLLRNISIALEIPAGILFAVALEEEAQPKTQSARKLFRLTSTLLNAAAHSVRASQAERDRNSKKR